MKFAFTKKDIIKSIHNRVDISVSTLIQLYGLKTYLRRWSLIVGVYDDIVENNGNYQLIRGLSSNNLSDNNNWKKLEVEEIVNTVFEFNKDTDWSVTAGGYFINFIHNLNNKVSVEVRDTQKKVSVVVETVDINTERIYVPYDFRFEGYIIITKH